MHNASKTSPFQYKRNPETPSFTSLIYSYFLITYLTSIPLPLQTSSLNQCHVFHMQLAGLGGLPQSSFSHGNLFASDFTQIICRRSYSWQLSSISGFYSAARLTCISHYTGVVKSFPTNFPQQSNEDERCS